MLILGAPKVQMFKNGRFLEGGQIYTYEAGTETPKATYPTWDDALNETNANSNPVILNMRGEADIVLKGSTKVLVKDENDVTLWYIDDLDSSSVDIVGIDGSALLTFTGVSNAVNHFRISNSAQGDEVVLEVAGEDSNIDFEIRCKGNENFQVIQSDTEITVGNLTITSGDLNLVSGDLNVPEGTIEIDGEWTWDNNPVGFSLVPAGTLMWFAGSTCPPGWLECTGAAISRTTYLALFNSIGTAFGAGDGSTTFNLPNQARNTLVGKGGTPSGTLGSSIGSTGGAETHTLSIAELPAHTHDYSYKDRTAPLTQVGPTVSNSVHPRNTAEVTSSTGGDTAHNIMQPSLVSMLIIRAF